MACPLPKIATTLHPPREGSERQKCSRVSAGHQQGLGQQRHLTNAWFPPRTMSGREDPRGRPVHVVLGLRATYVRPGLGRRAGGLRCCLMLLDMLLLTSQLQVLLLRPRPGRARQGQADRQADRQQVGPAAAPRRRGSLTRSSATRSPFDCKEESNRWMP